MNPFYASRRRTSKIAMALCTGATIFGLAWLTMILFTLFWNGFAGLTVALFTEMTPPPNALGGGLLNAIVGSLILTTMGGFSGLAGALALAVIALPVVVRTTEDMLLLVPTQLREAAVALGMPQSYMIRKITWRAARVGLVTGLLLAVARVSGETAPLLFTALSNQFWSVDLLKTMANLPVTINNFINNPDPNWKRLAWAGALLITLAVLSLNIVARSLSGGRNPK